MYKIFIDIDENKQKGVLKELGLALKTELIKNDNYIVYDNFSQNKLIANELEINLFIRLQEIINNQNKLEIIIDENSKVSNGFGKEIYKELEKIYFKANLGNGVIYKNNVSNILKEQNTPVVFIGIINYNDKAQIEWTNNNMKELAQTINIGIGNAFGLIPC
ncbi:MAG: hypothetical protein IKV94_00110 [Clostridia bacterium]|nr:hypothetical protein [Clostridia bacterium]MBR6504673.1 hypothetical protein [Clostridia bacterium]